jgi:hypothetical protein
MNFQRHRNYDDMKPRFQMPLIRISAAFFRIVSAENSILPPGTWGEMSFTSRSSAKSIDPVLPATRQQTRFENWPATHPPIATGRRG